MTAPCVVNPDDLTFHFFITLHGAVLTRILGIFKVNFSYFYGSVNLAQHLQYPQSITAILYDAKPMFYHLRYSFS